MDEFYSLEWREPDAGLEGHAVSYFRRVPVLEIMRDEETAVCINIQ
jgi:hypothetical protein